MPLIFLQAIVQLFVAHLLAGFSVLEGSPRKMVSCIVTYTPSLPFDSLNSVANEGAITWRLLSK